MCSTRIHSQQKTEESIGKRRPSKSFFWAVGISLSFSSRVLILHFILHCLLLAFSQQLVVAKVTSGATASTDDDPDPVTLRLRASWGGGNATLWHGSFRVQGGKIERPTSLGLDVDGPAAHYLHHGGLVIEPVLLRAYDGAEFTVTGPPDAELAWTLYDAQSSSGKQTGKITLGELSRQAYGKTLDDRRNRLFIQRAAGDDLRVTFDRKHLVFEPQEEFELTLSPTMTTAPPGESLNCDVSLQASRTGEQFWAWKEALVFDEDGTAPDQVLTVPLPSEPGAYTLVVTVEGRRLGRPLVRPKPISQREIDLIVAPASDVFMNQDSKSSVPSIDRVLWRTRLEIDPAVPGWMDRIRQLDQLNLVSRFYNGPLGSQPIQTTVLKGETVVRLEPGQWHAFPLAIQDRGVPHLLDVLLPDSDQQRLVISVVEPGADSSAQTTQLDSGVIIRREAGTLNTSGEKDSLTHRVLFWPSTKTPWVILANPDQNHTAYFRSIAVRDGPRTLAEAEPLADASSVLPRSGDAEELGMATRLAGPYLEKPVLQESFLINKYLESASEQAIDDWYSFHLWVSRLVDYLQYAGYNSAQITIAADGSGWYPSDKLNPTPKYDSGVFSNQGRDPIRKDVVELMYRHFDAAGLTLIPVIDSGAALPELERLRRTSKDLIFDQWNDRGQSRFQRMLETGIPDGFYQPTTPQFREAMVGVVKEVVDRYSHHSSWSGLGLRVGPGSHFYMADATWGLDPVQFERFKRSLSGAEQRLATLKPVDCVYGEFREPWLSWRNGEYLKTIEAIESVVVDEKRPGWLFLLGVDNFQNVSLTRKLHPNVRGQAFFGEAAWKEVGLDPANLEKLNHTVVLPARSHASLWSLASRRVERVMFEDEEMGEQLSRFVHPGAMFYRPPATLSVPKLSQLTRLGGSQDEGIVQPEFTPAGLSNRKRFVQAMEMRDCRFLFDGGWGLGLGQEDSTAQWLTTFSAIPAVEFKSVSLPEDPTTPVKVIARTATVGQDTWWYFINPGPWPIQLDTVMSGEGEIRIESVGPSKLQVDGQRRGFAQCTIELEPYGLQVCRAVGIKAALDKVAVLVSDEIKTQTEKDLNEFFAQVTQLEKEPFPLQVLSNSEFEEPATARSIPGWVFGQGSGVSVEVIEDEQDGGHQALLLTSQAPVAWVRSTPFVLPQTGRLSLMVWLRTDQPQQQPPLRLALEAKCLDGDYYQFANIGALAPENQPQTITSEWKPFAVHFDDLPQEGVLELRIGFDLMGEGEVCIDRVQIYDRWFDQQDQRVLLQRVSAARHQLKQGNLLEPQQFLESYWPRLLMDTQSPQPSNVTEMEGKDETPRSARANRSMLDRMKTWVPTPSLPFR
jgi:hypothetical protein